MLDLRGLRNFYVLGCMALLAACSNGRGSVDSTPPPPTGGAGEGFTVGGTITGLQGDGLVLQLNAGASSGLDREAAMQRQHASSVHPPIRRSERLVLVPVEGFSPRTSDLDFPLNIVSDFKQ